jgi:hypothetical protein
MESFQVILIVYITIASAGAGIITIIYFIEASAIPATIFDIYKRHLKIIPFVTLLYILLPQKDLILMVIGYDVAKTAVTEVVQMPEYNKVKKVLDYKLDELLKEIDTKK